MSRDRKETLLKIGERLFAQHGYRDIAIKDITAAAGMSMGSFYTYFPSKESFYCEILDAIEQRGVRDLEKHVNSLHSPLYRLKALFRYTVLSLRGNEILKGIYTGEKRYMYPGAEERFQRNNALFSRVQTLLKEILDEGGRRGVFRTSLYKDPLHLIFAIFTTVPLTSRGIATQELTDDVMTLIERGLKRWLRFRQRDERIDGRARRRAAGA